MDTVLSEDYLIRAILTTGKGGVYDLGSSLEMAYCRRRYHRHLFLLTGAFVFPLRRLPRLALASHPFANAGVPNTPAGETVRPAGAASASEQSR